MFTHKRTSSPPHHSVAAPSPHPPTLYHWATGSFHCLTGDLISYWERKCNLRDSDAPPPPLYVDVNFLSPSMFSYGQHRLQLLVETHATHAQTLMGSGSPFNFFFFFLFLIDYPINCCRNGVEEGRRICMRFNVNAAQIITFCEIHCMLHTSPVLSTLYVIGHHNNVENVAVHYCRFSLFQ